MREILFNFPQSTQIPSDCTERKPQLPSKDHLWEESIFITMWTLIQKHLTTVNRK